MITRSIYMKIDKIAITVTLGTSQHRQIMFRHAPSVANRIVGEKYNQMVVQLPHNEQHMSSSLENLRASILCLKRLTKISETFGIMALQFGPCQFAEFSDIKPKAIRWYRKCSKLCCVLLTSPPLKQLCSIHWTCQCHFSACRVCCREGPKQARLGAGLDI